MNNFKAGDFILFSEGTVFSGQLAILELNQTNGLQYRVLKNPSGYHPIDFVGSRYLFNFGYKEIINLGSNNLINILYGDNK